MNKILLSGFVIFTFIGYGLQQRLDSEKIAVITPNIPTPTTTSIPVTNTPTPLAKPDPALQDPTVTSTPKPPTGQYRDGQYTGSVADAFYGNIQVKAIISNGKISDVQFLQYPNDRRNSIEINTQAMPLLTQEAIRVQSAQVDGVSGATQTSRAFIESLSSALAQAK
jgi:uncharacterized protein with FMN-binding domain